MGLLKTLSYGYKAAIALRHLLYDHYLMATKLSVPVISVGNIVAGGSGKTPVVQYLACQIGPEKVGILSRGYSRKGKNIVVVDPDTKVTECGDEPLFLAKKLPASQVVVGKNRAVTGKLIEKSVNCLILDDGMQHRKLHRDVDICVMQFDDLNQKNFLPFGDLRDDPKRLKHVDLIIVNGVKTLTQYEQAHQILRLLTKAPITAMSLQVLNKEQLAGKKVGAFCAIAKPERFFTTLQELGCERVVQKQKRDHSPFTPKELLDFAQRAQDLGADGLVCTEKDLVKINISLPLPLIALKIALEPTFGKEHIDKIIKRFQT